MSIQSEINRIQSNVNYSLQAVAEYGIDVPEGANSNDLPQLINEIGGIIESRVSDALKSSLSLGIASDGLIHIFVDGSPVGDGVTQGKIADIYGYIDENNHIVLEGVETGGNYTFAFVKGNSEIFGGSFEYDTTVYYSITSNLTKCTMTGAKTVAENETYSATISPVSGYTLSSIVVTMGGTNITSSAVSGGNINIAKVTGDIVITASATETPVYYTVTKNLTKCSISNTETSVIKGGSYAATVSANSGYTLDSITVTMGGSPVTVTNGVINITNVTGNIVITAVAKEFDPDAGVSADGVISEITNGKRLSTSDGSTKDLSGYSVTGFIKADKDDVIKIKGIDVTAHDYINIVFYNSDKSVLKCCNGRGGTQLATFFTSQGDGWYTATITNKDYVNFSANGYPTYIRIGSTTINSNSRIIIEKHD